ncbi:MAG: DUF6588 family protein, partial [Myxococcota bacterium]
WAFLLFLFLYCAVLPARAQTDLGQFLDAEEVRDAEKLSEAYVLPFVKALGFGLANGWYNTAKPHKPWGFDLTTTVNMVHVPEKDFFYSVADLQLETVGLSPESSPLLPDGQAPTMFGDNINPTFRNTTTGLDFNGPQGLDLEEEIGVQFVPIPMVQLGLGVVKGTDVKVRFVPNIMVDDLEFRMLGFGVQHSLKQWIPGLKRLPIELSGFIGFTDISVEVDVSDEDLPNSIDQRGVFNINSFTLQGMVSRKFSALTLYGGLGMNNVSSSLKLKGQYDLNDNGDFSDPGETDPIGLNFNAGSVRLTTGMMLKLAVFTFHADYTFQKYGVLSAGFGISVR